MVKDKDKMCEHYNKTARDLPSLSQNQRVYVQLHPQCNQWTPATITAVSVKRDDSSSSERPRRVITRPKTYRDNLVSAFQLRP